MRRWFLNIISGWLKGTKLSLSERVLLSQAVLENLGNLPTHHVFTTDELGTQLFMYGKPVDFETAMKLRDSARGLQTNYALKFIQEESLYNAVSLSVHNAHTDLQVLWGRACIWHCQELDRNIKLLAGQQEQGTSL